MTEFIRYLNLPDPPHELLEMIREETNLWPEAKSHKGKYHRDTEGCELLDTWCKIHVCPDMIYGVHRIVEDLLPHRDLTFVKDGVKMHCESKLTYLMDTGGNKVTTSFWTDDKKTKLREYTIEPFRWHLFQCNKVHSVDGITGIRWGASAHVFHEVEDES